MSVDSLRSLVWNGGERRPTAPVRIVLFVLSYGVSLTALGIGFHLAGLSTGMRLPGLAPLAFSGLMGTCALVAAIGLDRRSVRDLGLTLGRDWVADLLFGLALAVGLVTAMFGVSMAAGWLRITGTFVVQDDAVGGFVANALYVLALFVVVGVAEELFVRGYLLTNVAEGLDGALGLGRRGAVAGAVAVTAGLFGLLHAANPNASWVSTTGLAFAGLLYGVGYALTGRLGLPIGFHVAWNTTEGLVYGFPVSGNRMGASVVAVAEQGPDLATGGAFGPEAGLLGVAARLVGIVAIVAYAHWRHRSVRIADGLTVPTLRWRTEDGAGSGSTETAD